MTSLRSDFRFRFILVHFCSTALINLVLIFTDSLNGRIYETEFPTQVSFLVFPYSISRVTLNFPPTLKTFVLYVSVAILSRYQSPVSYGSRNEGGNFKHIVNCGYYCHFPDLEFL